MNTKQYTELVSEFVSGNKSLLMEYFDDIVKSHERSQVGRNAPIVGKMIAGYRRKPFESDLTSKTLCVSCGRRAFLYALLDVTGCGDTLTAFTREDNWAFTYGSECDACGDEVPTFEPLWVREKRERAEKGVAR